MSWRLLNIQGLAGIAASLVLLGLLLVQKGEARHWRKQSAQYEQLYRAEHTAHALTVAHYRAAADAARTADRANQQRVGREQRAITERTENDLEARLAAVRTVAERLRRKAGAAGGDSGDRRAAPVPAAGAAPGQPGDPAPQDGFSVAAKDLSLEERLIATEQAIQLDELINWVKAQAAIPDRRL